MTTGESFHDELSPTKRALIALKQMQAKVAELEAARNAPIAIIALSCRFPGGATTPERFWEVLRLGVDTVCEIPPERWPLEHYYDPEPGTPGKSYVRHAALLEQIDQFDASFFGIAPRELVMMDPQQRLLLELAWEVLERAACAPDRLYKTPTGVFLGMTTQDYAHLAANPPAPIDIYTSTGNTLSVAAGRLAYVLGLQGPAMVVDTACSSSLVALHLAVQSLRLGECTLALAGGVSLLSSPYSTVLDAQMRGLAPDGRCKTFDAAADGYGRGEGGAMLLLKRLADAERDGDPIQAVIRGSAVNHDGPSSGLTVPNGVAQQQLIRQALQQAGVTPAEIDYIEAHGTGTALGDPIEIGALGAVFAERQSPVYVGSVKTNMGHLEAAAGIAGLVKAVLALQHAEIPPHLHMTRPNPAIAWEQLPIQVPTVATPFPESSGPRRAGVSSFGISGTNAHVVLEAAPTPAARPAPTTAGDCGVLPLSAHTPAALRELASRYAQHLANHPEQTVVAICATAGRGRKHFAQRATIVAASHAELLTGLQAVQEHRSAPGVASSSAIAPTMIAFLCTGQGSQYPGMGRQLYDTQPVFRETLNECAELLQPYLDIPLLDLLFDENAERIHQTSYTQPALFALGYALARLWQSWGIVPDYLLGHSVGEYVAACLSGVFSLADGLKLIAARGRIMQALPRNGSMLAVQLDAESVRVAIQPYLDQVDLAAINGPHDCVIAGAQPAIAFLSEQFQQQGVKTRPLITSHAFHSPLMDPILGEFAQVSGTISYALPQIPLISNVTGGLISAEIATPDYWVRHVRATVRFAAGIETLWAEGCRQFVEIGPRPVLVGMASTCITAPDALWLPSLRPDADNRQTLLNSLAQLYVRGADVDWQGVYPDQHARCLLPTYPFQRERYWVDAPPTTPDTPQIELVRWLHAGQTTDLVNLLMKQGQFSVEQQQILTAAMDILVQQYQQHIVLTQPTRADSSWLYRLNWELTSPHPASTPDSTRQHWLILADQGGVGQALADLLQAHGHTCAIIRSPAELFASFDPPPGMLVHLWSLDLPELDGATSADLEAAIERLLHPTLTMFQALLQQQCAPRLWLVTRQAVAVGSEPVAAVQTALWGFGRVIAAEHPRLWGGLIDLDTATDPATLVLSLALELVQASSEDQIALRPDGRFVARLHRAELPSPAVALPVHTDASYLITGGLGGLGSMVARWLIAHGARTLLLIGRSGAQGKEDLVQELQSTGANVHVITADITDALAVERLFNEAQATLPPIRGIIHTAGVLADGIVERLSWQEFQTVLAPKVAGAWNLHCASQQLPLDFFVCFSSSTVLFGSAGQANYAAANAFLDGLAAYRHHRGLPALSIAWGAWAEVGMAAQLDDKQRARIESQGTLLIPPAQGLAMLGTLLQVSNSDPSLDQIMVQPMDWLAFAATSGQVAPCLRQLLPAAQRDTPTMTFRDQLEAAPPTERLELLRNHLQLAVAQVMGLRSALDLDQGFFELGMDSLMSVELRNLLQRSLDVPLPATLAFEYPTVNTLASYLHTEVLHGAAVPSAPTTPGDAVTGNIGSQLSEEEALAFIDQMLANVTGGN